MVVIKLEEKIVIKAMYSGKSSRSFFINTVELENVYLQKLPLKRVTFYNRALLEVDICHFLKSDSRLSSMKLSE